MLADPFPSPCLRLHGKDLGMDPLLVRDDGLALNKIQNLKREATTLGRGSM